LLSYRRKYDVAILGSGIGGSMLACILAKHGLSTLLIEELSHPRFAIGESLIPETGVRLRILAEKHDVPEIGWIGSFHALRDNVSSNCGVKRSFAFMYHREGEAHRADETNQLPTLTPPFGPDSHLFRQDTDAYLASIAVKYGAHFRQQTKIASLEFVSAEGRVQSAEGGGRSAEANPRDPRAPRSALGAPDHVKLTTDKGEEIRCAFLIDAGGMRSHVATQFNLRDETPRFRTNTRAIYTHMMDVKPADMLVDGDHKMPSPLGQATMHHIFDGGWIWIIPFNNHRDATNPLTSVGMMLDRRKYPTPQGAPEDEFRSIISRFPTIRKHFADARAVRPWVGSGRIQYSQSHCIGPRYIQLPHAACFVDPLFSSGMSVLTVAIDLMADAMLRAFKDNEFSVERFQRVEDVVNTGFDHYDLIVTKSFDSFASYDLWNAWNRNWVMGNFLGTFGAFKLLLKYLETGNRRFLEMTTEPGRIGVLSSHLPEVRNAMDASADDIDEALEGRMSHAEAGRAIFERLGALKFLPPYMGFGDPSHRAPSTFTLPNGARHVLWYRFQSDPKWREYASFSLLTYAAHVARFLGRETRETSRRFLTAFRDVFFANNHDWRYTPNALRAHGRFHAPFPDDDFVSDDIIETPVIQIAK
jgi:tetracycline 7-halogenase / FADH2 O2-dependent halogenase